jgi:hypothetical protein
VVESPRSHHQKAVATRTIEFVSHDRVERAFHGRDTPEEGMREHGVQVLVQVIGHVFTGCG